MAQLEVKRKSPSLWWLWVIIILVVIGLAAFCYQHYYKGRAISPGADTTQTTKTTTP
jgi:protein-S-isoprenylcysteine O-methyltransferase Ste14